MVVTAATAVAGGAGQGVGDHVLEFSHVSDVAGELGDVAKVAALVGGLRLGRLGEGKREQLVIQVQCDPPAF